MFFRYSFVAPLLAGLQPAVFAACCSQEPTVGVALWECAFVREGGPSG
jgi:hypothetical protein